MGQLRRSAAHALLGTCGQNLATLSSRAFVQSCTWLPVDEMLTRPEVLPAQVTKVAQLGSALSVLGVGGRNGGNLKGNSKANSSGNLKGTLNGGSVELEVHVTDKPFWWNNSLTDRDMSRMVGAMPPNVQVGRSCAAHGRRSCCAWQAGVVEFWYGGKEQSLASSQVLRISPSVPQHPSCWWHGVRPKDAVHLSICCSLRRCVATPHPASVAVLRSPCWICQRTSSRT